MGRVKPKRVKGLPFYELYSEVDGLFLSFEFAQEEKSIMEEHWTAEVMRCAVGDFVELRQLGKLVRSFEGGA